MNGAEAQNPMKPGEWHRRENGIPPSADVIEGAGLDSTLRSPGAPEGGWTWEDVDRARAQAQIPMHAQNPMHYCEGCERSDVPLIVGKIMPGATEPVEWCEDCIATMPRAERVDWGLPYYVIKRSLYGAKARQTAGSYFVRSNGMPGGAVWSPNRAMGAREFITPAAAQAVIESYHAEDRWRVEEVRP